MFYTGSTKNHQRTPEYYESPTDNIGWVMGIAIVIVIVIISIGHLVAPDPIDTTPRVGDIWEFYGTGDPFNDKEKYTREIINIQGEYIKFIENRKDTLTRVRHMFEYNSKLIKRKKTEKITPIFKDTVPIIDKLKDTTK